MYTFETQIYALGVYWHAEIEYEYIDGAISITDLWLFGAYPEGCESAAVSRNDYDPCRIRADIGYLEPTEYDELMRRCKLDLKEAQIAAEEAMYDR
jgi:hypothetical protein